MKKMNVSQVRARNIVEIVTAISEMNGISRADIAARAGVSVMTVSNIMEVLLRNEAVYETEQRTENVGRNPALVYFSRAKWMMVLNLSGRDFTCTFLTLGLNPIDELNWEYDETRCYVDNLHAFLSQMKDRTQELQLDADDCLGVSISLPTTYLPESDTTDSLRIPELGELHIKETVGKYFDTTILAATDVKLAAIACNASLKQYSSRLVFYMYFGCVINGALLNESDVLLGTEGYAGSIGQMTNADGQRLEDVMRRLQQEIKELSQQKELDLNQIWDDPEIHPLLMEYVENLGMALYNTCCIAAPYTIILEGGCVRYGERLKEELSNYIHSRLQPSSRHMPEILLMNKRLTNAIAGAGMRLREKWIKELN